MHNRLAIFLVFVVVSAVVACGGGRSAVSGSSASEPDTGALVWLPMPDGAVHALTEDIDGDGRTDLVFVNHGRNFARVLINQGLDRWRVAADLPEVGYHPKDMISLPGYEGRFYLNNSEGSKRLRVFAVEPGGGMAVHRELDEVDPRSSVAFKWPGWGLSLAVVAYELPDLVILKGFDPETGTYEFRHVIRGIASKRLGEQVLVRDLDGDGVVELYVADLDGGAMYRVSFPGDGVPRAEQIAEASGKALAGRFFAVTDATGDGREDLIVPEHSTPVIRVFANRREGFHLDSLLEFPFPPGASAVVGFSDRHGVPMLAAGGYEGLSLYRFLKGGGVERRDLRLESGNGVRYVAISDLNGDGEQDLVVTLVHGARSAFYIKGPLPEAFERLSKTVLADR